MSHPTVIIGAGVIGVSIAYYLSRGANGEASSTVHLIEASDELFASASGFAGGFLARDWFAPALSSLGALSFDLHAQLAKENDGRNIWGWSRTSSMSFIDKAGGGHSGTRPEDWIFQGTSRANAAAGEVFQKKAAPDWFKAAGEKHLDVLSDSSTTAQLDPGRFCQFLLDQCMLRGVKLHKVARVAGVCTNDRKEIASVRVIRHGLEEVIPCTRIVISAGVWSPDVFSSLFPSSSLSLPIKPLAGHSIVVRVPSWRTPCEDAECTSIFSTDPSGYSPEMFARVDGTIWLGGLNSSSLPLPSKLGKASPDPSSISQLAATAAYLYHADPTSGGLEIVRGGLCFRPVTPLNVPVIAQVPDSSLEGSGAIQCQKGGGVFVATGHGPWGISNSLGTGKILSEMMEGVPLSANIDGLGIPPEWTRTEQRQARL